MQVRRRVLVLCQVAPKQGNFFTYHSVSAFQSVPGVEVTSSREQSLERVVYFGHNWSPVLELAVSPPPLHGHLRAPVPSGTLGHHEILQIVEEVVLEKSFEEHKTVVDGWPRKGPRLDVDISIRVSS